MMTEVTKSLIKLTFPRRGAGVPAVAAVLTLGVDNRPDAFAFMEAQSPRPRAFVSQTRHLKILFGARVNQAQSKHGFSVGAHEWCPGLYPARAGGSQRLHGRLLVHLAPSACLKHFEN